MPGVLNLFLQIAFVTCRALHWDLTKTSRRRRASVMKHDGKGRVMAHTVTDELFDEN